MTQPDLYLDDDPNVVRLVISAKWFRNRWRECEPEFIKNVCGGKCCKTGAGKVFVLPAEALTLRRRGATVVGSFLQGVDDPAGGRKCEFHDTSSGLCGVHMSGEKPFACGTNPFTINDNGTMIVSRRYRMLPCAVKDDGGMPAYKAFAGSLASMLGEVEAERVSRLLDEGVDNITTHVSREVYDRVMAWRRAHKEAK